LVSKRKLWKIRSLDIVLRARPLACQIAQKIAYGSKDVFFLDTYGLRLGPGAGLNVLPGGQLEHTLHKKVRAALKFVTFLSPKRR
jgi:hypothetical protein